ncbi:MAG: class I SAM-dependent methyltransferase, partial [Candidatus Vogelbacteria bacterium]|nr:class I SAM-dependent methyltransferase [Candidatus Vogelbacteria bacterium]
MEKNILDVKEYWNDRPCNIRHSNKPIGTREYFAEVEKRKYFVEPHIPVLAEFEKWKGKKVLEIGCGIGTDTINFLRAGATVTSVDLSAESVKIAKQRAEVYGYQDQVKFFVGDAEKLTEFVPVEQYDLVYSFGVIHHTVTPKNVIKEAIKYLKPGGLFKIMVYYRYSWKVIWIIIRYGKFNFFKAKELIPQHSEAQFGSPITFTYNKKELADLLSPLRIVDVFVDHIFPYSIPEYRNYQYKKVWYF